MNVLMVIESWFGNTRAIGDAIASGLSDDGARVRVVGVDDAPARLPQGVNLLVVGAPTQNRGLSTSATRKQAAKSGGASGRTGVREWLSVVEQIGGIAVAAFDTSTGRGWLSGSAAKAIARLLSSRGRGDAVETRTFVVRGTKGPLVPDEIENARRWGRELAGTVRASAR